MVALEASSKAQVDALHRKALQLGGKDDGAPRPRGEGFYAGYFRHLDGNKLNFLFRLRNLGIPDRFPGLEAEFQVDGNPSLRISSAQLRKAVNLIAQCRGGIRALP